MNRAVRYYAIEVLLILGAAAAFILRFLWLEAHRHAA